MGPYLREFCSFLQCVDRILLSSIFAASALHVGTRVVKLQIVVVFAIGKTDGLEPELERHVRFHEHALSKGTESLRVSGEKQFKP